MRRVPAHSPLSNRQTDKRAAAFSCVRVNKHTLSFPTQSVLWPFVGLQSNTAAVVVIYISSCRTTAEPQSHLARGYEMRTWTSQELCCVLVLWEGLSCRCGLKRLLIFENSGRFDWTFYFMTFRFWICDKQATRNSGHVHFHLGSLG